MSALFLPSLRGGEADAAIQRFSSPSTGLPRLARNDGIKLGGVSP